jgi:hypothetical protein
MVLRTAALVFLCLALPSFAQTVVTVPVTDNSAPGSPLQISGTITFTDQLSGNSVISSGKYELTATNVSGKGIVFLLVRFQGSGTRGGGMLHNLQLDYFFHYAAIAPKKNFVLDRGSDGFQIQCCVNPLDSDREPVAEVSVIYCEFTDGSTYGDQSGAADVLATRSLIIERLRQLDATKEDETFVRLLTQKLQSDYDADAFLEILRSVQKSGSTAAVRAEVRRDLGYATRRLALMQAATE